MFLIEQVRIFNGGSGHGHSHAAVPAPVPKKEEKSKKKPEKKDKKSDDEGEEAQEKKEEENEKKVMCLLYSMCVFNVIPLQTNFIWKNSFAIEILPRMRYCSVCPRVPYLLLIVYFPMRSYNKILKTQAKPYLLSCYILYFIF